MEGVETEQGVAAVKEVGEETEAEKKTTRIRTTVRKQNRYL